MVLALLAALTVAQATGSFSDGPIPNQDTFVSVTTNGNMFVNQPINTVVTTDPIKTKGYRFMHWALDYTQHGAATDVTMQCQQSEDSITWEWVPVIQYTTATPPVAKSGIQTFDWPVTVPINWSWDIALSSVYTRCMFTGLGASSSDLLTVKARVGI